MVAVHFQGMSLESSDISMRELGMSHGKKARELGMDPVIPSKEIFDQGEKAIEEFLESSLFGTDALYQLKVLVVGAAGVGKTSLTNALKTKGESAQLTGEGDHRATVSVEVNSIRFMSDGELSKGKPLGTLSLWDFGGQEEYYMTHAFFLSNRSLVMIVVDLGKYIIGDENSFNDCAGKWLRALQVQLSRPRVMIIGTKSDTCSSTAEEKMKDLMKKVTELNTRVFDAVKQYDQTFEPLVFADSFVVSNESLSGIKTLYKTLCELASNSDKGMALRVPLKYRVLQDLMSDLKSEKIVQREQLLQDVNTRLKLEENPDTFSRFGLQVALTLFHDLGIVLFYPDTFDIVFTDPCWVVNLVKSVFRHDLFLTENKNAGVLYQLESSSLPLKQLQDQLLNDCKLDIRLLKLFDEWKVLSGSDFDICVVLLKQFELLYSIRPPRQEDPVTEFIVPLFLREDFWGAKARRIAPKKQRAAWAKSIRKSFWKSSIKRSHRYVFYVFLPDGLFLRLVSRCYRLATYVSVSEHLLEAEVKYKDGEKIMIELRETRSKDGTGSIGITCLTSKATKLLDSVFTRFTDELKALIADSYKVLPYEELVETKNKDLVRTADIIKEESNVKTYRVVQRQGSIILDLESKTLSLASILEDVSPDAIVKVKGTYLFKKLLRQRVREDLMLRLDSEPIQVRDNLMVGLKSIYKRIGVSVGDHSFLNPNDDFVKTLELSLKKLYNSPSELNSLGQIILRLENRIRTDFDGFLSHRRYLPDSVY